MSAEYEPAQERVQFLDVSTRIALEAARHMETFCQAFQGVGHYIRIQRDFTLDGIEVYDYVKTKIIIERATLCTCYGKPLAVVETVSEDGGIHVQAEWIATDLIASDGWDFMFRRFSDLCRGEPR